METAVSLVKRVLLPNRLRRVPEQFSWIDQRLVRGGFIQRCDPPAAALYLLLLTVGDAQGLSYYGEVALCRYLRLTAAQLCAARNQLLGADLIAYEAPLYQVLELPLSGASAPATVAPGRLDRSGAQQQLQRLREQFRGGRG